MRSKTGPPGDHQSLGIEHPDLLPRRLALHALLTHTGDNQIGEADRGGPGAQKQNPLLLELAAGDLESIDHSRQRHAACTLDVVIVAADLVAIAGKQCDCVHPGPVLEVDAAIREDFLNRIYKLIDESVQLLGRRSMLSQADVERIAETGFVVSTGIQV